MKDEKEPASDNTYPSPDILGKIGSLPVSDNLVALYLTESIDQENTIDIPIHVQEEKETFTIWLKCSQKRRCWYFYAKYEYFASVTRDSKTGPAFPVELLELHIKRTTDGADYIHKVSNRAASSKTDSMGGYMNACGRSEFRACVRHKSLFFCTTWSVIR